MNVKRAFEGLQVITIGGILLANTLGCLDWGVWFGIASLWPLLLVALGVELIGRAIGSTALRVLSNVVIIGGLLFGALSSDVPRGFLSRPVSGEPFSQRVPADPEARVGKARIRGAVGRLRVAAADAGDLVSIEGRSPFGKPRLDAETRGESAEVGVEWPRRRVWWPDTAEMTVLLDGSLVWDIELASGVSWLHADLSALRLTRLRLDAGVGEGEVTLPPPEDDTRVDIDAGVSSLVLRVPEGSAVEIVSRGGIADIGFADKGYWERVGDSPATWRVRGASPEGGRMRIAIDAGISDITVETYRGGAGPARPS